MDSRQFSDDEILTAFRPLFRSIKAWAHTLLAEDIADPIVPNFPEISSFYAMPISELNDFLKRKLNRRLFVRAYVAHVMVGEFFSSKTEYIRAPTKRPPTSDGRRPPTAGRGKPVTSRGGGRPNTAGGRPVTSNGGRPLTPGGKRPPSSYGNRPRSSYGNRPLSSYGNRPPSSYGNRPLSSSGTRPLTTGGPRPPSSGGNSQGSSASRRRSIFSTISNINELDEVRGIAQEKFKHVMDMIGPWVNVSIRKEHEDQLSSIFVDAFKLSRILQSQPAVWSVIFPIKSESPLIFDAKSMKTDGGEDDKGGQKLVELILTPALWKRGNADGQFMDRQFCLEKAIVTYREVVKVPVPNENAETKQCCCVVM